MRGTTSMRKVERLNVTLPGAKTVSPSQLISALTEPPTGLTVSPAGPPVHTDNEVVIAVADGVEAEAEAEAEAVDSDTGEANEYSKKS